MAYPPSTSPRPLVESNAGLHCNGYSLEKFTLYETRARFYIVGKDKKCQHWQVLKIDRSEPSELNMLEDPVIYTQLECNKLMKRVDEGNKSTGGLTKVTKAYGIVGFIKFLESYYMILVTKRRQIGTICGHAIYSIEESQLITVPHSTVQTETSNSKVELRYKKLLSGVDLTKDFFFSYTYRIMQSLQRNVQSQDDEQMPYGNMFVWNAFLTGGIRNRLKNTRWTVALVHGFFEQEKLSVFGRIFSITLIGRRSRHFAGTRYLKRGVNDKGRVANDVETEQIVLDEETGIGPGTGQMSSVVQHRGSIPLFWSQEASRLSPKPDIILQRFDPVYQATRLHFEDLAARYGNPIIILSLIRTVEKRPREMMLRREFANAVGYLNQIFPEESRLKFIHWDFHKFAKSGSKSANVLAVLGGVAADALDLTGFYYSGKRFVPKRTQQRIPSSTVIAPGRLSPTREHRQSVDLATRPLLIDTSIKFSSVGTGHVNGNSRSHQEGERWIESVDKRRRPRYQSGVLRTNCIDCLDRTNVAQYAYGLEALGRQLHAMGFTDAPKLDPECSVAAVMMGMYQNMGDSLALQYGGSEAHNTVFPERQGKWKATTQSQEFLKSIRRYYSNTYTDGEKQDAINLFLGHFQPQAGKPALWELDSDYYLHAGGQGDEYSDNTVSQAPGTELSDPQHTFRDVLFATPPGHEDSQCLKLTSFDKLFQTCCSIKSVRLYGESELKKGTGPGATSTAPDAQEVQLKSPNWLFGQRKPDYTTVPGPDAKKSTSTNVAPQDLTGQEFAELDWLTSVSLYAEEDLFNTYLQTVSSEDDSWYGSGLLPGSVEGSDANQHYIQCCKGPSLDLVDPEDNEGSEYSSQVAEIATGLYDETVKLSMESALGQYNNVSNDFTFLPSVTSTFDHTNTFDRWISHDNALKTWA